MKGNMSQSRNADAFENFVPKTRKINGQTLDNDVQIDNVASADKLKTARAISLSGAVTSTPKPFDGSKDIDIPITAINESYLGWRADQASATPSSLDTALLPELSANRLAFIYNGAVKFERSEDAGATWTDVSEQFDGTMLCTSNISFGNNNSVGDYNVNRKHRITIDTVSGRVVGVLAKILLCISTEGAIGSKCMLEFGDSAENTQWTAIKEMYIGGWSGWNAININPVPIGRESTGYYRYVRLTFSIANVTNGYDSDLKIWSLRFICRAFYENTISAMARTGHLYSYDSEQNATFPKNLTIKGNTLKIGSTTLTETQLKALLALLT